MTAKSCLNHLRKGKKKSPLNLSHQSYMLEAEYALSRRKYDAAEKFYLLAIEHAAGVTHEHALACERFSSYYVLREYHSKAYEQIREAYKLYSKWGKSFRIFLLSITCLSFNQLSNLTRIIVHAIQRITPKVRFTQEEISTLK